MPSPDLTRVLAELDAGHAEARDRLWPLVYDELHGLAQQAMARERRDHTLQSTALVNEAFVRLVGRETVGFAGRTHFFATAAKVMRHILVDHARAHRAEKRGGDRGRISLTGFAEEGAAAPPGADAVDVLALDEALNELAVLSQRQAQVVELRFFGGMDVEQTAAALGVSERTVKGDWRVARAWLARRLDGP
jgi:RNA polymerase sigma factor (TIGR02999 family)